MDGGSFDIYVKYKNILKSLLNTMYYDCNLGCKAGKAKLGSKGPGNMDLEESNGIQK